MYLLAAPMCFTNSQSLFAQAAQKVKTCTHRSHYWSEHSIMLMLQQVLQCLVSIKHMLLASSLWCSVVQLLCQDAYIYRMTEVLVLTCRCCYRSTAFVAVLLKHSASMPLTTLLHTTKALHIRTSMAQHTPSVLGKQAVSEVVACCLMEPPN